MYGLHGRRLAERLHACLNAVGLADAADRPIQAYSGGMKRRANLAAGLLHSPQLLVLDEPTVGVDAQSRSAILELLVDLNRQGRPSSMPPTTWRRSSAPAGALP